MVNFHFDYTSALPHVSEEELDRIQDSVTIAHRWLHEAGGPGEAMRGWVNLPLDLEEEVEKKTEMKRVEQVAAEIRASADVFVVVGIGGSYTGARAAIEMLSHTFYNEMPREVRNGPRIYFAGHQMSGTYLHDLLELMVGQKVCLNVISKSGTTTEPGVAFRILRRWMEEQYGTDEALRRIFVTTDKKRGALRQLADTEGYGSFIIPDDIGGRYTVLTPVGLLPMAVAGIPVGEVIAGATEACRHFDEAELKKNPAYQYAACRNILYRKGKMVELLVSYEPALHYLSEWWKQLFGESEGKEGKGLFPAAASFTTDLHSMGQYIQEGQPLLFETVLSNERPRHDMDIPEDPADLDGLNYLRGKGMEEVNRQAMMGTLLAHTAAQVPNLLIHLPEFSPYWFGYLVYFFEKACGMSGYLLDVNPFDQPGVEAYKNNMFALLGKPGYEVLKGPADKTAKR